MVIAYGMIWTWPVRVKLLAFHGKWCYWLLRNENSAVTSSMVNENHIKWVVISANIEND